MNNSSSRFAYPILALGLVLTAVGALASDAARGILNGEEMAERTAAALDDPRVSAFVADRLTNAVLAEKPDLVAFRPIIVATADGLVETAPFRAIVRSAVRTAHRSAVSTTGQRVLLSLPDVGVLVQSAVQSMSPEMAEKIPPRLESFASDLNQRPGMDKVRTGPPPAELPVPAGHAAPADGSGAHHHGHQPGRRPAPGAAAGGDRAAGLRRAADRGDSRRARRSRTRGAGIARAGRDCRVVEGVFHRARGVGHHARAASGCWSPPPRRRCSRPPTPSGGRSRCSAARDATEDRRG